MSDAAQRHGGPDAGWYVPSDHGWQRISDGEVGGHGDAAHFMSNPAGPHAIPNPMQYWVLATGRITTERDLAHFMSDPNGRHAPPRFTFSAGPRPPSMVSDGKVRTDAIPVPPAS